MQLRDEVTAMLLNDFTIDDQRDLFADFYTVLGQVEAIDKRLAMTLEENVNAAMSDMITRAFALGFNAARDPLPWFFQTGRP